MKPNPTYLSQTPEFWALVKIISQKLGYSFRRSKSKPHGGLKRYTLPEATVASTAFSPTPSVLVSVVEYLNYRADILTTNVEPMLMDESAAKALFNSLRATHHPTCYLPMNLQKGAKRHHLYFSGITNILTEVTLAGRTFIDNPKALCTLADTSGKLGYVLSRTIDGAYPTLSNPKAIWELKEYYGTTTFGSRVADGVYETQLDGFEIKAAKAATSRDVKHYLLIDDKFTWWTLGKSYLCRLVDATHQGLVDEVIYGKEVVDRWPAIVSSW